MTHLEEGAHNHPNWNVWTYEENIPYLSRFLSKLLAGIGRTETRIALTRYVEGLLLPARGKLIRPLAERLNVDPQSMQQAVTHSPWDDRELWSAIRKEIIPLLGPLERWVINERVWEKQGDLTVGVGNQSSGKDSKKSHCQVSLELLATNGSVAAPLASRLYLPEEWADDSARRKRALIPEGVTFATKPAMAIELLKEASRDGLRPDIVIAGRSYGENSGFRAALGRLGFEFFLEIDPTSDRALGVETDFPHWNTTQKSLSALGRLFAEERWTQCAWVLPDGVFRHTRVLIREVLLKSGELDGKLERVWLVIDWPAEDPKPYGSYFYSGRIQPSAIQCLRYSRFRSYEAYYRSCFEKTLHLGCYQGRSWNGFHHHLVLGALAYLFVLRVEQRNHCPFWVDVLDETPVVPAIAEETTRFFSVLRRNTPSSRGECCEPMTAA